MKLAHIFSIVVGLHLAIIVILFVTPGCASDSSQPAPTAVTQAGDPARAQEQSQPAAAPVAAVVPAPSEKRYPPTRPSWNLNETTVAEVIVPADETPVEVLEVAAVENVEIIQPSSSGLSEFNSASLPPPQPSSSGGKTYIVKKGDALSTIARRHGVTLGEVMAANGFSKAEANRIRIGQAIIIPDVGDEPQAPATVPSPQFTSTPIDTEGTEYTVQRGDSLSSIAVKNRSTVRAIMSANGLSNDRIIVGQKLLIPTVEPEPAPVVGVPNASGDVTYIVQPGDTLGGIARRYGVSVKSIMLTNGIDDPRKLRVKQKLIIPTDLKPVTPIESAQPAPVAVIGPPAPTPPPAPAPLQPAVVEEVTVEEIDLDDIDIDEIESVQVEEAN